MLYLFSYEVKSVQVSGISELCLVPSTPMCSYGYDILMSCTLVNMMFLMLL